MFSATEFTDSIFSTNADFDDLALSLFYFQYENNPVYRQYMDILHRHPQEITHTKDIPFLPINFFKTHEIKTGNFVHKLVFESSSTTQTTPSRCFVRSPAIYERSFRRAFRLFYGDISDYAIIGLLPSYLERGNSSLVYMVNDMILQSGMTESGFYLNEFEKLYQTLSALETSGTKTLLIGVTFGLLDFAEKYPMRLKHTIIMETGGMKGRREEWTREEVHNFLKDKLGTDTIHSEYGMTELFSQAYSKGKGRFNCPPWMRITLRDMEDPLSAVALPKPGEVAHGLINIIDLANIDTCGFIATDDIGLLYPDGSFEVRGRRDQSDLRGCSLMAV